MAGVAVAWMLAGALAGQHAAGVLWRDPGEVSKLDFGGALNTGVAAPKPPFSFIREDRGGTQPKVLVRDAAGATWDIKFGYEVKPESFTWRIPVAVGYFVEPGYYVASGTIVGLGPMRRKSPSLEADGRFKDGRFQIRDPKVRYLAGQTWKWTSNPFAGSRELKGLAILIMLASNWDNKDGTAGPGESNTGLFERAGNGRKELLYAFTDWGSGMGAWGDKTGQTDWNCRDYTRQTGEFVKGMRNGEVEFGYEGHMRQGFQTGIHPSDIAWLMKYLGQITDQQLRAGLRASGATAEEEGCFAKAIRARIEELRAAAR